MDEAFRAVFKTAQHELEVRSGQPKRNTHQQTNNVNPAPNSAQFQCFRDSDAEMWKGYELHSNPKLYVLTVLLQIRYNRMEWRTANLFVGLYNDN